MKHSKQEWWNRFQKYYTDFPTLGLALDLSRMNVDDAFFSAMSPKIQHAFMKMAELENGAIANPDENRMVGHYWLRNPTLAPIPEIRKAIEENLSQIKSFIAQVHAGKLCGQGGPFKNYLLIGIGGSALGPQFVSFALGDPRTDKLKPYFFDNTDPDGMHRVLAGIGTELNQTLCIIISKSGGTKETRNGMLVAKSAFDKARLDFGQHTVAVTTIGSELHKFATDNRWLATFPMWDWVGGRTSELSAAGLLPAALQGIDIDSFLSGARQCDELTRTYNVISNPASQLALALYASGNGKGVKNMVVLPYKDRLELFSKYLQQLLMESLGKELDLDGSNVNQGITVFGNKGSTDQHSFIQQLRDGLSNFFVLFIEVQIDEYQRSLFVEPAVTSGDFLHGFYLGTREALSEKGRESLTLILRDVSPFTVGMLIALFERTVGLYASLINVNAYHQPGVEAGKKGAVNIIAIQQRIFEFLQEHKGEFFTLTELSNRVDAHDDFEIIFKICEHLSQNPYRSLRKVISDSPFTAKYGLS